MLQGAYTKAQANKEQLKRELELGKERARAQAEQVKEDLVADDQSVTRVRRPDSQ